MVMDMLKEFADMPADAGLKDALKEFADMSVGAGIRTDWIQAAGGNTSVKISDDLMYIKASGVRLCEVNEEYGASVVDYKIILEFLEKGRLDEAAEKNALSMALRQGTRPSIETFLHSFTGKYTLHTHPVAANVLLSSENGMKELKKLFPESLCVGYCTPGIKLGAEIYKAYKSAAEPPEIIFLQNHGLIISGDSSEYVMNKTQEVLDIISDYIGAGENPDKLVSEIYTAVREIDPQYKGIVCRSENRYIYEALKMNGGRMWKYRTCPDCVVYCGENIPDISGSAEAFRNYAERFGIPGVVLSEGELYIIAPDLKKAMDIESVLSFSAKIAVSSIGRDIQEIPCEEQSFLTEWDAEKYRKQMK